MTKSATPPENPIEKLLQERAQFVSWLTRLNSSGEAMPAVPEAVRSRIRGDYERRLDAVMADLKSHQSALEEQVDGLSARRAELQHQEGETREQLSEAEVRHLVGEYDETKWQGIRAELNRRLVAFREALTQTTAEIDKLTEVLTTIRTPATSEHPAPLPPPPPAPSRVVSVPRPVAQPQAAPPPPPAPVEGEPFIQLAEPEPVQRPAAQQPAAAAAGSEIPFRQAPAKAQPPAAAKPAPAPKKDDQGGRTLWFPSGKQPESQPAKLDELAFLKSVTDAGMAPSGAQPAASPTKSTRASGGFAKPETPAASPASAQEPARPSTAAAPRDSAGGGQPTPKTLKCGECGTLNRPTEWYCERCGAELAAL
jgi:hypothetical protein